MKKEKYKIILASDAIKLVVKIKLKHFKLGEFFDYIVFQDDAKCIKSDLKFFKFILKKMERTYKKCCNNR